MRGLAVVLVLLLAAAPTFSGTSEWTLAGHLLGGSCEVEIAEYPGNGFAVQVEQCELAASIDPSLGVGPTVFYCRRETCLFGPCSVFSVLHSGALAGPIEGCAAALEAAPAPLVARGWLGGETLYALAASKAR